MIINIARFTWEMKGLTHISISNIGGGTNSVKRPAAPLSDCTVTLPVQFSVKLKHTGLKGAKSIWFRQRVCMLVPSLYETLDRRKLPQFFLMVLCAGLMRQKTGPGSGRQKERLYSHITVVLERPPSNSLPGHLGIWHLGIARKGREGGLNACSGQVLFPPIYGTTHQSSMQKVSCRKYVQA